MFQFRRFPTYAYFIQRTLSEYCSDGFPHSEIPGSMDICSSPRLIAACHVLLRLLMPRHSPCALISLTYFLLKKKVGKENFALDVWRRRCVLFVCLFLFQLKKGVSSGSHWVWIMQASEFLRNCLCYPLLKSSTNNFLFSLCYLLFIHLVTLFSFQGAVSDSCWSQIQTLTSYVSAWI